MNRMTGSESKSFLSQAAPPEVVGPERIREVEEKILETESALKEETAKRVKEGLALIALRSSTPGDIADTIVRERRRLKAKIHLGDATESDLSKFDKDAAERKKSIAKQSSQVEAIAELEEVVRLIDEKIVKLTAQGKALVAERHRLWGVYLRDWANRRSAIAREHAGISFQATCDVFMLGSILIRLEGHANGIGIGARDFCFPTLGTLATELPPEKMTSLGVDTNIFSIVSDANLERFTGIPAEKPLFDEMEKQGLKYPGPPPPPSTVDVKEPGMKKVPGIGEGRPIEVTRKPDSDYWPTEAVTEE